jgi:dethiobiotin synthetase
VSLAIVGTGTGVGKTVVSAVLLARWGREVSLAYWKPVATGSRDERDSATVAALIGPAGCGTAPEVRGAARAGCGAAAAAPTPSHAGCEILPEAYLFPEPLSPHLAARLAGETIDPDRLLADFRRHRAAPRALVVEGAGGLLVPLTDDGYLLADLFRDLDLPCLLVAASGLGTINHTLLTLEAMRARGLAIAGVVLDGPPNPENRRAIERLGQVEVIAEVPPLEPLDAASVARAAQAFDPGGHLAPYLSRDPHGPEDQTLSSRATARDLGGGPAHRPASRSLAALGMTGSSPTASVSEPSWIDLDRRHVWHPYTQMLTAPPPVPVVRAEGVYLHTADGRRILDAVSSWWVNVHGHHHPRLDRALAARRPRRPSRSCARRAFTSTPPTAAASSTPSAPCSSSLKIGASLQRKTRASSMR